MKRFEKRVGIVTGAAGGIGRAAVLRFVDEGARVIAVDRDSAALDMLAAQCRDAVAPVAGSVADDECAEQMVAAAIDRFGRLDFAFLNAGIEGRVGKIAETDAEDFDRVVAVNVRGVFLGLAAVMRKMRDRGGSIVVTSSTGALRGSPGLAAYCASKHAVVGLVKTAALEEASSGIRVNAVCPGATDTRMMRDLEAIWAVQYGAPRRVAERSPLGRYASPEEIAAVAAFLCSDDASFVTGSVHVVDGGLTAGPVSR